MLSKRGWIGAEAEKAKSAGANRKKARQLLYRNAETGLLIGNHPELQLAHLAKVASRLLCTYLRVPGLSQNAPSGLRKGTKVATRSSSPTELAWTHTPQNAQQYLLWQANQ